MKRIQFMQNHSRQNNRGRWIVLSFILAAFLPFILRLGLDVNAVNRQALNQIYREWRVSDSFQELKKQGEEIRFVKSSREGVFEDLFQSLLQSDFKLVSRGDIPVVTGYFEKGKVLTGRIEWRNGGDEWPLHVYSSETRFINNGLLLGFWVSLILLFFGMRFVKASALTAFFMLLWQVRWNPIAIIFFIGDEVKLNVREWMLNIHTLENSLFFLLVALAILTAIFRFLAKPFLKKLDDEGTPLLLLLSLIAEPLILFAASKVMGWGEGIYWWKVYLGSLCFRFVGVSFLLSLLIFKPRCPEAPERELTINRDFGIGINLALPVVFLLAGGWQWLNAVLIVDAGTSILMLKSFLTGLLLSALVGSRFASLILGIFVFALVAPPTEGHWVAAAVFGFFLEGLWMGWWLSPLKGGNVKIPMPHTKNLFFVCAGVGWVLGIFLYTAGVPLALSWGLVLLSIWSYGQMDSALKRDIDEYEMGTRA